MNRGPSQMAADRRRVALLALLVDLGGSATAFHSSYWACVNVGSVLFLPDVSHVVLADTSDTRGSSSPGRLAAASANLTNTDLQFPFM